MANEEHVKRLKQGVAEWNAWRKSEKFEASILGLRGSVSDADLSDADLDHANLIGANLSNTDLNGAYLTRANLSGADLSHANLMGTYLNNADLSGANLIDAVLFGANLSGANLSDAKLIGASLIGVNLIRANLSGANLTSAILFETTFGNADLSGAIGLEECEHTGPSIIDYQTLQKSGRLALSFLRGVGLTDEFIEYLPSLLGQAIQYYSCFISYSSKDQDFADRIYADLQNNGVRCWFAPHDLPIGEKILDGLDAAIRVHDKVLLILSKHSIKSDWVEDEVSKAFAEERKRKQIVLFPVRLDDTVMKTSEAWAVKLRDQRNIGDFRHWKDHDGYKKSFERVLRDLKRAAG